MSLNLIKSKAEESLLEQEQFLRATLDGLSASVCVVDAEGTIIKANRAWNSFGTENNADKKTICEGINYLDACRTATVADKEDAEESVAGINAVIAGTLPEFVKEYPCHSPDEQRWFSCKVHPLHIAGAHYAVISHENITDRKQAEQSVLDNQQQLEELVCTLEDKVDEAKKASKEFELINQKYKLLFESVNDGIFIHDMQARILACNTVVLERLGYTQKELLATLVSQVDSPEECQHIPERLARLREQGHFTFETVHQRKNGSRIPTEVSARLIQWDDQPAVMSICRDITDRKLAEVALRESEDRYRVIFEGSIQGILVVDLETGRFSYANPSICRMLAYSETELLLLNIGDIHPADQLGLVKTSFGFVSHEGKTLPFELPCLRKDGTVFYAKISAVVSIINGRECAVGFFTDVTERRAREAGQEKTRKELAVTKKIADEVSEFAESIINTVRESLISLDQDLRVVTASRSFYDFFKVKPEETIGQLVYDLGNKQWDIPKLRELLETILPQKTTFDNYEVEHEFATIGRRTMLLNARQIHQVLGKERIILLAIEDITDRKQAEEELANQKNQLLALMNHIPDLVWLKDTDGVYLNCNKEFERFLGAEEKEIIGKTDYDFVDEELADFFRANDRNVIVAGHPINNEESFTFADDGHTIFAETRKTPAYNHAGEVIGVLSIARDITERNQWDTARKSSLSLLNATLEATADAILVVDLSGRITCLNQKFIDLWHIPAEIIADRVYKAVFDHVASQVTQPVEFINRVTDLYEHPGESSTDTVLTADGRIFRRYSQPQRIDDEIVGRVWSYHDITVSKIAEKKLVKARDLANIANRSKSEFLSNMSHEIRTPLNAIIGFSDLMMKTNLSPHQQDFIGKIHSSGSLLLNIISDILDFSKIEANQLNLEQIPFRLGIIIANATCMVQERALDKGLNLIVKTTPEAAAFLVGDPHRLVQILVNLLNNAVKFTEHGDVQLEISLLKQENERVQLKFTVRDSGIGISEEQINKLFRPFIQADGSTTRKFGGTGLGLSISKQLVELMEGEIWCESILGRGSNFSFSAWFGIGQASDVEQYTSIGAMGRQEKEQSFDFTGSRVLLVEDNVINRQLAIELLKDTGAGVETAANGEEAVSMIIGGSTTYDLVLMDIQMPIMDGYEATRRIRSDRRFTDLPIIAVTANALVGDREKSLVAGMNDHIIKPFDPEEFYACLLYWIKPWVGGCAKNQRPQPETFAPVDFPENIPGIDLEAGLQHVLGNDNLYLQLLRDFQQDFGAFTEQVSVALQSGELKTAMRLAHTLKGVAGSLGACGLQEKALELESAMKEKPENVQMHLDSTGQTLETLLAALQQALPAATTSVTGAGVAVDISVLRLKIKTLGSLLERGDMDAEEAFLEIQPALAAGYPVQTAQIARLLESLDFKAALKLLQELDTASDAPQKFSEKNTSI